VNRKEHAMLDPRYLRYMSLEAHALSERQPRPVVEKDEAAVNAALIHDGKDQNPPEAA